MSEFMTPYEMGKVLEGVIPANKVARPNFLQTWFANTKYSLSKTVNFDKEFETNNTVAMYVAPTVDAPIIKLQGHGSKYLEFAYVKEGLTSPDWEEIDQRQLGQQFGQVDVMANWLANLRKKAAIVEANIENLFELNAANLMLNGSHTASSPYHETVLYDFNRTVVTTDAGYLAGIVPEIDLTTLNGNGGAGKRAWDSTGGTKAPTPYQDLIKACNTVRRRGMVSAVILSNDAWEYLEADITANYATAANLSIAVDNRIQLHVLPVVEKYEDLNFRRTLSLGDGTYVDIFTYGAIYHDRTTGVKTPYIGNGKMLVLPSKDKGIRVYGRIMHPDAGYEALPRYINTWKVDKTGKMESEIHLNYLLGHTDIDTLVSWTVTSG
jgi:hypothetical protein